MRSEEKARYFLDTIMAGLPINLVSNSFEHVIEAAEIKAGYALAFADCFTVATARRFDATVFTGDPEFKAVEKIVEIEWLR
jgi:ribonuclease VapC